MKKGKLFLVLFATVSTTWALSLVGCKINKTLVKSSFKHLQKEMIFSSVKNQNPKLAIDSAINTSLNLLQNQEVISEELTKKIKKNKQKKRNKVKKAVSKLQKAFLNTENNLLEQLSKVENDNKSSEKRYKIISTSLIISSSILSGIAAGLGTYFGLKNINSLQNMNKKALETTISNYKNILANISPNESLNNIFNKIIELSFSKQLPKAIFDLLKTTLLKDVLQDFSGDSEKILISKLESIEKPSKELLDSLFNTLTSINTNNSNYISTIVKKIKEHIVKVVEEQLPKILRGFLEFVAAKSSETSHGSILARIIEKILNKFNIKFENISNISEVLNIYSTLLSSNNNVLLDFIVKNFKDSLEKSELTYNLINDIFSIINKTIEQLFAKENNKLSIEKVLKEIIPKIIQSIKFDENKRYEGFVNFINEIFENSDKHSKWVYEFINFGKFEANSTIYLDLNPKKINNKIIFPKLEITFGNIFNIYKNKDELENLLNSLMNLLFEPLVIQLKDNKLISNTKKSIFRLTALVSFLYYKYFKPTKNGVINWLLNKANPFEPETYVVKILDTLLKKHKISTNLDTLLGKKHKEYLLWGNRYDIFDLTKSSSSGFSKLNQVLKKGENN